MIPQFEGPEGAILAAALERGATVCASTRRLARVLQQAWTARMRGQGKEAWRSPDILPYGAWQQRMAQALALQRASEARPMPSLLGEQQELLIWEQAAESAGMFDGLLQPQQLAAAMMDAHRLATVWNITLREQDAETPDGSAFLAVREHAEDAWRRLDAAPGAAMPWRAVEAVRVLRGQLPREIVFAGFDLTADAAFDATLHALEQQGVQVHRMQETVSATSPRLLRYPGFDDELRAAALWCRGLLEDGETDIAVVVPHLDLVRATADRVFSDILQPESTQSANGGARRLHELSLGPRAADEPLIHAALLLLEPLRGMLPLEQWSRVLHSPFLRGSEEQREERARLDGALRGRGMREASVEDVLRCAASADACAGDPLLEALHAMTDVTGSRPPGAWAERFAAALSDFGWPGGRALGSREFQARSRFEELLDEFSTLDPVTPPLRLGEALARLRTLASAHVFQPRSTGAPVQVMGVRETAGLRFRHLRVLGMNDDIWPPVARPSVFIPLHLQRRAGVPEATSERFLEELRRQTALLLQTAADVTVSCSAMDGDRELLPSPLLGDVTPEEQPPVICGTLAAMGGMRTADVAETRDVLAPAVDGGERIRGGTRVLALQSDCPFRAFAELRLHAARPDTVEHGVRALDRGTLVHSALEFLWQGIGSRDALLGMDESALVRLTEECVDRAIAEQPLLRERRVDAHFLEAERSCLLQLLEEWLLVERRRGPFEAVQQERRLDTRIGGLALDIRADRIDTLPDGSGVLLDYKTGKKKPGDWMSARPREPQIPLYVQAVGGRIRAAGFAQLRRGDCRIVGLRDDAVDAEEFQEVSAFLAGSAPEIGDWDGLRAQWSAVLTQLAEDFLAGKADVDPRDTDTCTWCELAALCRVHGAAGEEDSDASA